MTMLLLCRVASTSLLIGFFLPAPCRVACDVQTNVTLSRSRHKHAYRKPVQIKHAQNKPARLETEKRVGSLTDNTSRALKEELH